MAGVCWSEYDGGVEIEENISYNLHDWYILEEDSADGIVTMIPACVSDFPGIYVHNFNNTKIIYTYCPDIINTGEKEITFKRNKYNLGNSYSFEYRTADSLENILSNNSWIGITDGEKFNSSGLVQLRFAVPFYEEV